MTFQEALKIIYADSGTHDSGMIHEALGAISFFKENVLELNDYETDQLFEVMRYIHTNKLGELK